MVRSKLPDGSGLLKELPRRTATGDAAADDARYCAEVDKVAAVFGNQRRGQSTADEHKMYMRIIDEYLVREGFGSYVEARHEHNRCVQVVARRDADGRPRVIRPQMLVGYLLQMSTGHASVPKGGHDTDVKKRAETELATACGPRSNMRCARAGGARGSAREAAR